MHYITKNKEYFKPFKRHFEESYWMSSISSSTHLRENNQFPERKKIEKNYDIWEVISQKGTVCQWLSHQLVHF
jgi:hypothetical protein